MGKVDSPFSHPLGRRGSSIEGQKRGDVGERHGSSRFTFGHACHAPRSMTLGLAIRMKKVMLYS